MEKDVKAWMEKIEKAKSWGVDLSRDEDLSIALMNLISLEEHFYFTAMKTGNKEYLKMLGSIREMRKNLLKKIVTNPVGEEWCISKHLLAASMRLIEVGTKELQKDKKEDAEKMFRYAFDLWSLFFAINLKLVEHEELLVTENVKKQGMAYQKFSDIMKKIINCCKEW